MRWVNFGSTTLVRFFRLSLRNNKGVVLVWSFLGPVMLAALLVQVALTSSKLLDLLQWVLITSMITTAYWWSPWLMARNVIKKSPSFQGDIRLRFDEEGMLWHSNASRAELKWSTFVRCREDEFSFLLYSGPNVVHPIPKRFFAVVSDVNTVRQILKSKVTQK